MSALAVRKVVWGARTVGVARTARGGTRLLALRLRRPYEVTVATRRRDLAVRFRYPSQLIPTLVVFGDLLEPELELTERCLGPGDLAVDVGASIGTWTMVAARTGARVLACEPDEDNLRLLHDNVRANGLSASVTVRRAAVGRRTGSAVLRHGQRRYLNQVAERAAADPDAGLPLLTLGDLLEEAGETEVAVLKVNTAGHEAAVLLGALPVLARGCVGLVMLLDGLDVRAAVQEHLAGALAGYRLARYDAAAGRLVGFEDVAAFAAHPVAPLTHYLVLQRRPRDGDGAAGRAGRQ